MNEELFDFANEFDLETWTETLKYYVDGIENGMPVDLACFNLSHSYNMPLDINIYDDLMDIFKNHKVRKYEIELNNLE